MLEADGYSSWQGKQNDLREIRIRRHRADDPDSDGTWLLLGFEGEEGDL